jgi:pimeloyl-ACP methyl ester carboxylesterase
MRMSGRAIGPARLLRRTKKNKEQRDKKMNFKKILTLAVLTIGLAVSGLSVMGQKAVTYRTVKIDGLDIFYREAGERSKPTILLLHGFPTSSFMFRNLMPRLADKFHVIAPDYPGFGQSSAPAAGEFSYTFDNLANVVDKFTVAVGLKNFSLYVQDYGSPVGFRLALKNPQKVQALIVQNGNAYEEGLTENAAPLKLFGPTRDPKIEAGLRAMMKLEGTKYQYVDGAREVGKISPDAWTHDQALLDRPGNVEIQLALLADYASNVKAYPAWHEYLRKNQPPTLIVWGKNDPYFNLKNIDGFQRDLKTVEVHVLDGGHFALEEYTDEIAAYIRGFFDKQKIK